jgi:hypothetical protein
MNNYIVTLVDGRKLNVLSTDNESQVAYSVEHLRTIGKVESVELVRPDKQSFT